MKEEYRIASKQVANSKSKKIKGESTLECLIDVPSRSLIFRFFLPRVFLFQPAPSTPPPPQLCPVYFYWGKFPAEKIFFEQYTYDEIFEVAINVRPVCIVFCFVSSCKEANTVFFCKLV